MKANISPAETIELLAAVGEPQFLVSAHDLAHAHPEERGRIDSALARARESGSVVLLDSGNYESFWLGDRQWTPDALGLVLAARPAPLVFCFDIQRAPEDVEASALEIVDEVRREQALAGTATVCPIVHGPVSTLPARVRRVAEVLQPILIAVAERELGDGLLERARNVRAVRQALDEVAPASALHLLGTGNPLAIAIYVLAGAQTFDGLEWCQTCADPETAFLFHFQHRDLVRTLEPELTGNLPYPAATLVHNLLFFREWLSHLRRAAEIGTVADMVRSHLPRARAVEVAGVLAGIQR